MGTKNILDSLGQEIFEPEEETFLLFSQALPSQDLGFVDAKSSVIDITIHGRDLVIHQSPTLLSSNRSGGTTGAVVWKITPLFASWLAASKNVLFNRGLLHSRSAILELGCGISGVIGLALEHMVGRYVSTDQIYVQKLIQRNLEENRSTATRHAVRTKSKKSFAAEGNDRHSELLFRVFDWETDEASSVTDSMTPDFDVVVACDCIYNNALIQPLVQACVDTCSLRPLDSQSPTICIVAQQLRSSEVFEEWLMAFTEKFHVWRLSDDNLIEGLQEDSGFVVHCGILKRAQ